MTGELGTAPNAAFAALEAGVKIVRWLFLLAGLTAFGWGALRIGVLVGVAAGARAEGRVVDFREETAVVERDALHGTTRTRTDSRPVVRYRSPLDGRLHRFTSATPFSHERGEVVRVRVSRALPGRAELAGAGPFVWPAVALLGGWIVMLLALHGWNAFQPGGKPPVLFFVLCPPRWTLPGLVRAMLVLAIVGAAGWAGVWGVRRWAPWAEPVGRWLAGQWTLDLRGAGEAWEALGRSPPEGPAPAGGAGGLSAAQQRVLRLPIGPGLARSVLGEYLQQRRLDALRGLLRALREPESGVRVEVAWLWGPAVAAGDAEAMRLLAAEGIDPTASRAIYEAVSRRRDDLLQAVLDAGARPTAGDVENAIYQGNEAAALRLLERAAAAGPLDRRDARGRSLLDQALLGGLPRIARALEARNVPTALPRWIWAVVEGDGDRLARELPEDRWPTERPGGESLLVVAARAGQRTLVARMMSRGEAYAWDVREAALQAAAERGHVEAALAVAPGIERLGLAPAVSAGRWACVRALVEAGNLEAGAYELGEALAGAARAGDVEMVRWLLAHGADPNWADAHGGVALEWADTPQVIEVLAPVTSL